MRAFSELINKLDTTTKTGGKLDALVDYLDQANDDDKLWCVALLSGRRPKRPVKTALLRQWAAEMAGIPLWIFEESYFVVGDLAETVALVLPEPKHKAEKTLTEWMKQLLVLKELDESEVERIIKTAWSEMVKTERFVFNKLITGGFRIGVSQKLMVKALSRHLKIDENKLAHRLMGAWTPENTTFKTLLLEPDGNEGLSRPYPFYLSYPLEGKAEDLGPVEDWQLEYKWDGIRSQLIRRKGRTYIWSRGEELVTDQFAELEKMSELLMEDCVIDGEILAYKENKPLSFNYLQKRLGRKNISKAVLEESPVSLIAYDLLEYRGADLRKEPLSKRRELLEKIVELSSSPHLLLSQSLSVKSWNEAAEIRAKSRENLAEGLMIKRLDSDYKVGRKRGDWWKWKVDPMSIDAVMIYAMRGHGRRANLYTDYTFAVWNGEELVPFTKAYSGLTDAEIREVDWFIKKNTIDRFGPVRSVKPELVFEVGFEGIAPSNRHKSGIALRFPRILRRRTDKKAEEANTLEDLKALLDVFI